MGAGLYGGWLYGGPRTGFVPPAPDPADPLEVRVLDGVKAVAQVVSLGNVDTGRVYRRLTLESVPDRDGLPCVVVAWTPGRPYGYRVLLSTKKEWTFPVTALLLDRQGTFAAADPEWRAGWAGRLMTALVDDGIDVAECVNTDPDSLTILDLSRYDEAGVWASPASVIVTCRTGP